MKIAGLDRIEKTKMDMEGAKDVWKQVPISKNDGSPVFSFRVFTVEPGGHTPFHAHAFEHLNYIIDGHGTLVTDSGKEHNIGKGEDSGKEHNIGKGDFALVLPDERHQYKNKSSHEPLIIICAVPKEHE
ncbi:MAG: cupin domain-containing protein [Deltaproteobacteria bacterium]|nr:cupin domain-containing protein [Deltaproteobacteria bacterium]